MRQGALKGFLEAVPASGQLAIAYLYAKVTMNHINVSHSTQTQSILCSQSLNMFVAAPTWLPQGEVGMETAVLINYS